MLRMVKQSMGICGIQKIYRQLKIINNIIMMWDFFDSLERDGPSLAEPRKPKADYKYLLRGGLSQE